ncbi:MAG: hypothetical protein NTW14_08320 [bacterium]|nr:hypothetical protein [bacterium]
MKRPVQINKITFLLILCTQLVFPGQGSAELPSQKIEIDYNLEPNALTGIIQSLTSMEDTRRILWLDQTAVFSGTDLIGHFSMRNRTADTLKLSPQGIPLVQYLKLIYAFHLDSSITPQEFPMQIKETVTVRGDYTEPLMSGGSVLLPHATMELDVTCLWDDLLKIAPTQQIIDFLFIWDNTAAVEQDSGIYGNRFAGRSQGFNINKIPATRIDTLYVLHLQSDRLNRSNGQLEALAICNQMLQIDSLNFWACRTATDALWKLERFDEAAIYANRGLKILQDHLPWIRNPAIQDEAKFHVKYMQERLALIEKHESFRAYRSMPME